MSRSDWLADFDGVQRDEPLSRQSQFGVGGTADWFVKVRDPATLQRLVRTCSEHGAPLTMIGAGSNALILDGGIRGVVVRYDDRHLRRVADDSVELGGGCMLPRAALDCARLGLAGLEFGIGVPGTCGASVYGNAGAFGAEMADVLVDCAALTPDGDERVLTAADCGFAYRYSRFKDQLRGHVVTAARVRVHSDDAASVRRRTDDIQRTRKTTQPYGVRSLGSVFKNPPDDSAGRLVEACGLKGRRHGGAEIAAKHANFILNVAHATAADVLELVQLAHDTVQERFGVDLEREIVELGEPSAALVRGA
ncbi:MAG: UDP-N-acetylmuramate dehydrogenase [Candidatus Dormibacteria bacterium]